MRVYFPVWGDLVDVDRRELGQRSQRILSGAEWSGASGTLQSRFVARAALAQFAHNVNEVL